MKLPMSGGQESDDPPDRVDPSKLLAKLATLNDMLVQPRWEGKELKSERSLLAFVSNTSVRLLLKIATPPLKLMVVGRTWDDAHAALEAVLRSPDVPWEQDAPRDDRAPRKKK